MCESTLCLTKYTLMLFYFTERQIRPRPGIFYPSLFCNIESSKPGRCPSDIYFSIVKQGNNYYLSKYSWISTTVCINTTLSPLESPMEFAIGNPRRIHHAFLMLFRYCWECKCRYQRGQECRLLPPRYESQNRYLWGKIYSWQSMVALGTVIR